MSNQQNPIPKAIALILVSIGIACLLQASDASSLAKLDSMSAADYIQHQRTLHQHSFFFHFIVFLIIGGFYLGMVEFISFILGFLFKKQTLP
jgi:hypothetical protein